MHSTDTRIVFEDIKGLIRSRKSKQDRQCNGQKRTYNAMAKKGQTMQWPKRTDNAMAKKDRQCNGQKGHKKTNNGRPNTTHKIKD
jgi:hypothetical protein